MIKELFPAYCTVISKAIAKADTAEEQTVCNALIEHCENDFLYFQIPGKAEKIQELRDQLQVKHEELKTTAMEAEHQKHRQW